MPPATPTATAVPACRRAGVPANGWENELLRRATDGLGDVWLAYARQPQADGGEGWTVGIPVREPDPGDGDGDGDARPGRRPVDVGPPDHGGGPPSAGGPGGKPTATDTGFTRASSTTDPVPDHALAVVGGLLLLAGVGVGTGRRRARAS